MPERLSLKNTPDAVVVVGGLRASRIGCISGIIFGEPLKASRESALPLVPTTAMSVWADDQAKRACPATWSMPIQFEYAKRLYLFGVELGNLPVAYTTDGPLSLNDVDRWATSQTECILDVVSSIIDTSRDGRAGLFSFGGRPVTLLPHVIACDYELITSDGDVDLDEFGWPSPLRGVEFDEQWSEEQWEAWGWWGDRLPGEVFRRIARVWGCEIEQLVSNLEVADGEDEGTWIVIGYEEDDTPIRSSSAYRFARPPASVDGL